MNVRWSQSDFVVSRAEAFERLRTHHSIPLSSPRLFMFYMCLLFFIKLRLILLQLIFFPPSPGGFLRRTLTCCSPRVLRTSMFGKEPRLDSSWINQSMCENHSPNQSTDQSIFVHVGHPYSIASTSSVLINGISKDS